LDPSPTVVQLRSNTFAAMLENTVAASGSGGSSSSSSGAAAQAPQPQMPTPPPKRAAPPLFSLAPLLLEALPTGEAVPKVSIVDVGAMLLGEAEDIWRPLLHVGLVESVVGFEPCQDECDKLNADSASRSASSSAVFKFLPWALGDGSSGEFRRCSAAMTSSMLEPNIPLLRRFVQLEEVTTVVERTKMDTKRLDDLRSELPGGRVDFLKLDVQGYELAVLHGSRELLKQTLMIHTEVEFAEMYEKQPLFAEVDQFLRSQGFVFHRFASVHGRPMKPIHLKENPLQPISQVLWADAVYVRDMWDLKEHSKDELLKTALILHEVYHSYDVAHHVLAKCSEAMAKLYLDKVLALR